MKPKLRFKEFSDEWEEKKLGDIATCTIGLVTTMTENYVENGEGTPLIRNSDIYENRLEKLNHLINLDLGFAEQHKHRFLHTDDIITVHTGDIGTSTVISDLYDGSLSFAGLQTRVNSSLICPIYLSWCFNSFYAKKFFLKMSTGDGRNNLNLKDFKRLIVPIPSLQEQEKIGQFLSLVDKRIEKQEQRIELLKERKKGWMQKIFNQEIRFKDENGNDYPDWEEKKLGEVLDYERADKYIVASTDYDDSYDIPVLTANKSFILGYTNDKENIFNKECIIFDDFTMESKYVNFDFKVKSSAIKILTSDISNIYFLSQLLKVTHFISEGHARHYISIVQNKSVLIPSLPEQEKIAGFLSKQDELIEKEEKKLELLKEQKKGLLQQMFV